MTEIKFFHSKMKLIRQMEIDFRDKCLRRCGKLCENATKIL